jgi:hypothetical protein
MLSKKPSKAQPHRSPSPLLPPHHTALATTLLHQVKGKKRLPRHQREQLIARARATFKDPLSKDDRLLLARLSYRELNRMGKSNMTEDDRMLLLALRDIKKGNRQ